jgi:FMN phosphatase YigB (HAD superfamily)
MSVGESAALASSLPVALGEPLRGARAGLVSDIHFDLRPVFAEAGLDRYVSSYVLSFEHGVQKPDAQIFRIALDALAAVPAEALMVGDRSGHDGGAVAVGIPTLLVPPLFDPAQERLHIVVAACGAVEVGRRA